MVNSQKKKYFAGFDYDSSIITDTSKFWISAQDRINQDKKFRFFKTHNVLGSINGNKFTDLNNTVGCVYIIRDPRNVVTSLKNHYEIKDEEALKFMINEKKFIYDYQSKNDYGDFQFISSWEKNYQSWNNQSVFPVKFIKYENLYNNTFNVFRDLIEFIEKITNGKNNFDKKKAQNAVQSCSFEKLKSIEKKDGFSESILSKNESKKIPFFHLGPENNWRKIFNKEFQNELNMIFSKNLKELDYI